MAARWLRPHSTSRRTFQCRSISDRNGPQAEVTATTNRRRLFT